MDNGNQSFDKTPHRKSIRLRGYDYSRPGSYFVTICIHDRTQLLFGSVVNDATVLNGLGEYVRECWLDISNHYPNVKLDEYVIMPNHVHGIITIVDLPVGARLSRPDSDGRENPKGRDDPAPTLGSIALDGRDNPAKNKCENPEGRDDPAPTLGSRVGYFKYQSTKQINAAHSSGIQKIWQRGFFDHIIRNEKSLFFIRQYIRNNPINWELDKNNTHTQDEIDNAFENGMK